MIDLKRHPEVIEAINAILSSGGIAEVKCESKGLVVISIERKLKHPPRDRKP